MKASSIEYLTQNIYIWEARKLQVNKHLSQIQAERFLEIAKEIKPDAQFQIRECQSCIDALVLFVFKYYEAAIKRKIKKAV
jgi:hypothetical protein